jgi:peptide/nickel transport system ATP-binding protein
MTETQTNGGAPLPLQGGGWKGDGSIGAAVETHPLPNPSLDGEGAPILQITGLKTHFISKAGTIRAVDGVDLVVREGEVLGLVGESGSGKSVTGLSIMRLIDKPGRIVDGRIAFNGIDLLALDDEAMRRLRGDRIAMIFQDPMMTLNPVLSIGTQMIETLAAHPRTPTLSKAAMRARAIEALTRVGIGSPERRLASYPHQLSGGMRQRVAIAIALLNDPDLIICDEPTTALDVTIQAQILAEMQALICTTKLALIWITHDLTVVAGLADRIAVMYAGRIVESGTAAEIIESPRHPYTRGLIDSTPAAAAARGVTSDPASGTRHGQKQRLQQIPGSPPSLARLPQGCAFRPRCSRAQADCVVEPPSVVDASGRGLRCFHPLKQIEVIEVTA